MLQSRLIISEHQHIKHQVSSPYSCPCLLLLLLNLPLLLSGSLLLCLALWLSSKPNQSLPLHLLEPLPLPLLLTCVVGGLYLVIVPAVGALAAMKQRRYVTATVREYIWNLAQSSSPCPSTC